MRMIVRGTLDREISLPLNHQHLLTGVVYSLLGSSDEEYARFLHEEGYAADGDKRRFKLFVFSPLRARRRFVSQPTLRLGPGPVEWRVSSPVGPFLEHCATALLAAGELTIGRETLRIDEIGTEAVPRFGETAHFTCLSPFVASVARPDRSIRYLRPQDAGEFSEAVRRNAVRKYQALYGEAPADDRLRLIFDTHYLERQAHGGTKKIDFKGISVVGAFAPFTLEGSAELMQIAWECGLGEKNAQGFGMIEVARPSVGGREDRREVVFYG